MAPEQIRGNPPVSHKTDLYALGVVLYQLLVGKPPFEGSTPVVLMHSHLNEPAPRPSARIQEIPKVLDELVVNLMAKSPTDRPWDAAVVGMKLTELRDKVRRGAHDGDGLAEPGAGGKPAKGAGKSPGFAGADSGFAGDEPSITTRKKKARKSRTLTGTTARTGRRRWVLLARPFDARDRLCSWRRSSPSADSSPTGSGRRLRRTCTVRPRR